MADNTPDAAIINNPDIPNTVNPDLTRPAASDTTGGVSSTPTSPMGETTNAPAGALVQAQQARPMMQGGTQVQQQAPQAPQGVTLSPSTAQHVGRLAKLGHMFNSLAGQQQNYTVDPNTGQTVATPVKQTPGTMFRSMLAGALMGAAGGEGHDFAGGIGAGGMAVLNDQRQQDLLRRKQAQEQFQNQMEANRNSREERGFNSSEQLKAAEIAHMNVATMSENQLMRDRDVKSHMELVGFGKNQLKPFMDAGLKPTFQDVPESEMNKMSKSSVARGLMWEPTGIKPGLDKDGKPTYELTYSAVNPEGKIKITKDTIDMLNKSGMYDFDPTLKDTVKVGQEMDARQLMSLNQQAQVRYNEKLKNDKDLAETDEVKARTRQANAAADLDRLRGKESKYNLKQAGALQEATDALTKAGGDFDELAKTNAGAALTIAESLKPIRADLDKRYQAQLNAGEKEEAAKTLVELEGYDAMIARATSPKGVKAIIAANAPSPQPGSPEAEAQLTQKNLAGASLADQDKQLVDQYSTPNALARAVAPLAGEQVKAIRKTISDNPSWTTSQKARYIRKVTTGSANPKPPGAVGTMVDKVTGKAHWVDKAGKSMGLADDQE